MKVEVSPNFKKHARKTILSIFVFAFTYILLLVLAIGLTIGFTLFGLFIFASKPMFLTGVLCLGLIASGLTILFFLLKFVFAQTKTDTSHLTAITAQDEPQLFALIDEIVNEVDTSFPKKVFLSHDVNASVFYDSTFWSMFLPIRKNLQIGMGLINVVTQQELKAILAHEFGHFSQRSMKLMSYVYHVNQIIYNMLYKNEALDNTFEKWGNVSGYSAIFIGISVFIIQQIQNILKYLYEYINLNYLALSREMEFHADEIAAHVAGSKALADSLLRLGFANHALEYVLNFYEGKIPEQVRSNNIYPEQSFVMLLLGQKNRYQLENDLPQIQLANLKKYDKSKLNLDNQWASHPTDEDRIKALQQINIVKNETNNAPAMALLTTDGAIAQQISDKLFSGVQYEQVPGILEIESFKAQFTDRFNKYTFDLKFNDFYDFNNPILKNELPAPPIQEGLSFEILYADSRAELIYELNSLKNDKYVVEAISNGEVKLKTFDYGGKKYRHTEAYELLQKIEGDIVATERLIDGYNHQIHHYFTQLSDSMNRREEYDRKYYDYAAFHKTFDEYHSLYDEMSKNSEFIFKTTPFAEIEVKLSDLKKREPRFKNKLRKLLELPSATQDMDETVLSSLNTYIHNDLVYFNTNQYKEENLAIMVSAISEYKKILDNNYFKKKKNYLDFLLELEQNKK
ncbi:M48 family metallopeptidase [Sphingobacterium thalpophilum]|uniref:M48 family metallopeptidase n=1 Tax=Sphingobacterium thalpophilum TaxID=259 RepID=A0ABV4HH96_9SPHI